MDRPAVLPFAKITCDRRKISRSFSRMIAAQKVIILETVVQRLGKSISTYAVEGVTNIEF